MVETQVAHRASIILYNLLVSNAEKKYFLLPANVCPIVPAVFLKAETPFLFVDIDPDTFCMDLDLTDSYLKDSGYDIGGLLFVRNFGYEDSKSDKKLRRIREQYPDALIIDDRCLSRPTLPPKFLGDVELFSTGYSKFVELGYGGFAHLREEVPYDEHPLAFDENDHDKVNQLFRDKLKSNEPLKDNELKWIKNSDWLGDTSQKPLVEDYFNLLKKESKKAIEQKRKINSIYNSELREEFLFFNHLHDWRFNIKLANKDFVLNSIFEHGLFASSHYQSVAYLYKNQEFEKAEEHHFNIINLFNDFRIREEDAYKIVDVINNCGVPVSS